MGGVGWCVGGWDLAWEKERTKESIRNEKLSDLRVPSVDIQYMYELKELLFTLVPGGRSLVILF